MTALLKYDAACRALAEAKTIDEVKDWKDKAAAVKEYARRSRNRALELDALEIRERARRRCGELLIELREEGRFADGKKKTVTGEGLFPVTLEGLEIGRNESSYDQKVAKIDGNSFERLLARCRSNAESHPEKHSFDVLRAPDAPINGSRAIMGSRQEPDDSLDYFPTPPWATRALMERVILPYTRSTGLLSAWEPACGEGHIAEVLREYCTDVLASDIFDYGYGDQVTDFLTYRKPTRGEVGSSYDWIVTNPPFGDKAMEFVLKAMEWARVGIAMFFRTQWAVEGIDRFEKIFRETPPELFCPFVERVNLCKGRWEPEGSTATSYCWLVWRHVEGDGWRGIESVRRIAPGCRQSLTRPDDAERFTAHPVIAKKGKISLKSPEPNKGDQ